MNSLRQLFSWHRLYAGHCLHTGFLLLGLLVLPVGCSPRISPYQHGPVMSQETIHKTFQPILDFMEVKPGIAFADVGAGSGAITVMMATLMDSATVYIQDIDTSVLNSSNVDKILDFYSQQSRRDLRTRNTFHLVIGDTIHSLLPESTLDVIYSNATIHVFSHPDPMLQDLRARLKPDGKLFIRDSFKAANKAMEYCSDPGCAKPLLSVNDFLQLMQRNGFTLVKQTPDLSGYPVFGFVRTN
jgi:SAM-dependent methyltransferase